tara:strand:+ start:130 stop:891 length:762 start_codon:yes stop_codon:yes gene_type:complete
MSPKEKTINKIRKLMKKAEAEGCTQAEAAAFAAKAAEIAAREAIEMSDIEWTEQKSGRPIGKYFFDPRDHDLKPSKVRIKWQESIIHQVALSQNCKLVLMGGNSYDIIGRSGNIEIVVFLATYLSRYAIEMSQVDYVREFNRCKKAGDVSAARGFKAAWLQTFAETIHSRLLKMRKAIELEYASNTALVRLTDEAQEVQDWMNENMNLGRSKALAGRSSGNVNGRAAGRQAGSRVDITGRATTNGSSNKQLNS